MQSIRRLLFAHKGTSLFNSPAAARPGPSRLFGAHRRPAYSTESQTPKEGSGAAELQTCQKELAEKEVKFAELKVPR